MVVSPFVVSRGWPRLASRGLLWSIIIIITIIIIIIVIIIPTTIIINIIIIIIITIAIIIVVNTIAIIIVIINIIIIIIMTDTHGGEKDRALLSNLLPLKKRIIFISIFHKNKLNECGL